MDTKMMNMQNYVEMTTSHVLKLINIDFKIQFTNKELIYIVFNTNNQDKTLKLIINKSLFEDIRVNHTKK